MTSLRSICLLVVIALLQVIPNEAAAAHVASIEVIEEASCDGSNSNEESECMIQTSTEKESKTMEYDQNQTTIQQPERKLIPNEWGEAQIVMNIPGSDKVQEIIDKTFDYMTKRVLVEDAFTAVRERCRNLDGYCSHWAAEGHCVNENHKLFMIQSCSPACLSCELVSPMINGDSLRSENVGTTAAMYPAGNQYHQNYEPVDDTTDEDPLEGQPPDSTELGTLVPSSWGKDQNLGLSAPHEVLMLVNDTYTYMTTEVYPDQTYSKVYQKCQNRHRDCSLWALDGHCETSEEYMKFHCAPACQSCEQLDYSIRCPINESEPMMWGVPGSLNRMFERITTDPYWESNHGPVTVLSSPDTTGGPWIVTIDNFLTDEECDKLVEIGGNDGYEKSLDYGTAGLDGTFSSVESDRRTSKNAWCNETCYNDTISGPALTRMEKLTGIPYNNSEYVQLLRYQAGEFYRQHHDYTSHEYTMQPGPRILTVFLYLSDVEAGGGTRFGRIISHTDDEASPLTVMPKKRRALLWPSVLNDWPMVRDDRTFHEALEVEAGVKYAANAWLHNRDFKTAEYNGCV